MSPDHRYLFAVGGTGGHLFPAIALADQIKVLEPTSSILFAGGGSKSAHFFEQSVHPYHPISSGSLNPRRPAQSIKSLFSIAKGVVESIRLIRRFQPTLLIGFGSYYSLPLLLAANMMRTPYVLHEQNTIPGRVIRLFSRGAAFTGIHFPTTKDLLKGECRLVGLPVRQGYCKKPDLVAAARQYYDLKEKTPVLLIFGGSQGAYGINRLISDGLVSQKRLPFQILHFTGSPDVTQELRNVYSSLKIHACVKDFEKSMHLAWQVADCVICRAGASSIAEQIAFEVPGILIPFPHAMDNHQEINADFFVDTVGGGVKFLETQATGSELIDWAVKLIATGQIPVFQENIRRYKASRRQADFAAEIISFK